MTRLVRSIALIFVAIIGSLFIWHAFARFYTFHNQTYDLAMYTRMAWGMVHGSAWEPIVNNAHMVGVQLSVVLLPLGLLGILFGTAEVLMVAQTVAVCAVCWPLARMGARRLGDLGAVTAVVAWLLYPNISHVCTYEFHPGTIAMLPMTCALECLDREDRWGFLWWTIGVIACRADMSIITLMMGMVALFHNRDFRRVGYIVIIVSIIYLLFFFLIRPFFAPVQGSMHLHFSKWGNSFTEIISTVLFSPSVVVDHFLKSERLLYLPKILAPLVFLPLLRPHWLVIALPTIAVNLLSEFPTATDMDCHYSTPVVPILIIAAIDSFNMVSRIGFKRLFAIGILFGTVTSTFIDSAMPWSLVYPAHAFVSDEYSKSSQRTIAVIPQKASVQAPDRLLPHLAERLEVHRAPPPEYETAYVVIDLSHRLRYANSEDLLRTIEEPTVRNWFARSDHALIHEEPDLAVFERNKPVREGLVKRYYVGTADPDKGIRITGCLSILDASLQGYALTIDFVASGMCPNDLAIRLGSIPKSKRVDLLFDGLLSPVHLRAGDRVKSIHSLTVREREAILVNGLYVGALRQSGTRPDHDDPVSVLVPLKRGG